MSIDMTPDAYVASLDATSSLIEGCALVVPIEALPVSVDAYRAALRRLARTNGWRLATRVHGTCVVAVRTDVEASEIDLMAAAYARPGVSMDDARSTLRRRTLRIVPTTTTTTT